MLFIFIINMLSKINYSCITVTATILCIDNTISEILKNQNGVT